MKNILFLCTGNSARSIMAEAIVNRDGGGRYRAYSAGSQPKGAIHPLTLEILAAQGCDTVDLRSKNWDEFAGPQAPQMDMIVTVCTSAAGEACPRWPGRPATDHWDFDDPAAATGSFAERRAVFARTFREIESRIGEFLTSAIELKS